MPISHHVRPDGIVVIERTGTITSEQEDVSLQERMNDVRVVPGMLVLVDARGLRGGASTQVIHHLAAIARATTEFLNCGALALVVASDLQHGMARMYMALTDLSHPNTRLFREFDEALSWLKQRRPEPADPKSA